MDLSRLVVEALEVLSELGDGRDLVDGGPGAIHEDGRGAADALLRAVLELLPRGEFDKAVVELVLDVRLLEAGDLRGVLDDGLGDLRLGETAERLMLELLLVALEDLGKKIAGLVLIELLDSEDNLGDCVSPGVERKGEHEDGNVHLGNLLEDLLEELPHLVAVWAARVSEEGDLDRGLLVAIDKALPAPRDWHHSGSGWREGHLENEVICGSAHILKKIEWNHRSNFFLCCNCFVNSSHFNNCPSGIQFLMIVKNVDVYSEGADAS